jgi:hypothetical protein
MQSWNLRLKQAHQARRVARTELLPLPIRVRDALSLEYHLQLEALRAGEGSLMALQLLMRVVLASAMLDDMGYGNTDMKPIEIYETAANTAFASGEDGRFSFDDRTYRMFAYLLTSHDLQLASAPVKAIDVIAQRLEQFSR